MQLCSCSTLKTMHSNSEQGNSETPNLDGWFRVHDCVRVSDKSSSHKLRLLVTRAALSILRLLFLFPLRISQEPQTVMFLQLYLGDMSLDRTWYSSERTAGGTHLENVIGLFKVSHSSKSAVQVPTPKTIYNSILFNIILL